MIIQKICCCGCSPVQSD